jgi:hypothetical protein
MSAWSFLFGNNMIPKNNKTTYIFSNNSEDNKKIYLENLKTIFVEDEHKSEELFFNPWDNEGNLSKKKLSSILSSIIIHYNDGSSQFYTSINDIIICLDLNDIEQIHINFIEPLSKDEENRLYKLFNLN